MSGRSRTFITVCDIPEIPIKPAAGICTQYILLSYNGNKKYQTVIPMSPKTHILSANSYELEIIRLLYLLAPDDSIVKKMVKKSLERLKTTCYGSGNCAVGECFYTALIVLRFLASVAPHETEWIEKLITLYREHVGDQKRHRGVAEYYRLCMSELNIKGQ